MSLISLPEFNQLCLEQFFFQSRQAIYYWKATKNALLRFMACLNTYNLSKVYCHNSNDFNQGMEASNWHTKKRSKKNSLAIIYHYKKSLPYPSNFLKLVPIYASFCQYLCKIVPRQQRYNTRAIIKWQLLQSFKL